MIKQILKNEIVYTVLDKKYIIECKCLDFLKSYFGNIKIDSYSNYTPFYCDKVIVMKIYDNNKNIIVNPIIVSKYNYSLKKGSVMCFEKIKNTYFKFFLMAFMDINKINNIKYYTNLHGKIYSFENDIIKFDCHSDILNLKESCYSVVFYNKNNNISLYKKYGEYIDSGVDTIYCSYDNLYNYMVKISYYEISILRLSKKNPFHTQYVACNKKLKILKIVEYNIGTIIYKEDRNDKGSIHIEKYDYDTGMLAMILDCNVSDNVKKNHENFSQELLEFYNSNIENNLPELICIKNKELYKARDILLNTITKYIS